MQESMLTAFMGPRHDVKDAPGAADAADADAKSDEPDPTR